MMRGQTTICGALTRKGTSCQNIPMKNGRCRMHGGKSTGPKDRKKLCRNQNAAGNKARVTTGEYETITWETLTAQEQNKLRQHYGLQPYQRINNPYVMEDVRIARMLQRSREETEDIRWIQIEEALTRTQGKRFKQICSMLQR
ncbi:HGGxSTG domain-containing protein [Aneurinibacillus thermoaerophilus]|uniref:Uncharacterized protein n=1 Tax=Aneurinibacillus thermoaerophilus TaxID=143495 RepID=A0ABX8YEK2_ANETH|nr:MULTISPECIES: HGGxSTG domain-containing protein [Aneurinibacillus]AMA73475.1 hypothetical protein ACH33_11815 [Aneurinibacillus sp. XH2]QYY43950.1 hypothetical protein K3F53_07110 [Aneurinibacillus thermoaerophilus]